MNVQPVARIETTATVSVYQIPDSPYQLRRPLLIEIERDAAGFVVSEPSTGVFHYDPDLGKALTGFLRVFVNEYEFLRKNQPNLSAALSGELERFSQILSPVE